MPIKLLHLPPKTFTVTSTGHFHLTEKLTVSGDHTPSPSFPLIFLSIQIPCFKISCVDSFIQPKPYSLELNLGMTLMFAIRMMSYTFRWKVEDQCLLGVACCRFFLSNCSPHYRCLQLNIRSSPQPDCVWCPLKCSNKGWSDVIMTHLMKRFHTKALIPVVGIEHLLIQVTGHGSLWLAITSKWFRRYCWAVVIVVFPRAEGELLKLDVVWNEIGDVTSWYTCVHPRGQSCEMLYFWSQLICGTMVCHYYDPSPPPSVWRNLLGYCNRMLLGFYCGKASLTCYWYSNHILCSIELSCLSVFGVFGPLLWIFRCSPVLK